MCDIQLIKKYLQSKVILWNVCRLLNIDF